MEHKKTKKNKTQIVEIHIYIHQEPQPCIGTYVQPPSITPNIYPPNYNPNIWFNGGGNSY